MKSQNLAVSLSLTTQVASFSVFQSTKLVGARSKLFLSISLIALLETSVIFEVSVTGLDLSDATVDNPTTVIMSSTSTKIKVMCTDFIAPLMISNVINQVIAFLQELHTIGYRYSRCLR